MKIIRHLLMLTFLPSLAIMAAYPQNIKSPMADVNQVIDNTPDSIEKAKTARPVPGSSRKGDNPVLFLVGNSTMRTGTLGNGNNGQWGWGYFMPSYFDDSKITVENHALGGMSTRTFYNKLWKDVLKGVRPGDWVIIELGHNDNGPYDSGRARATIPGIGKESLPVIIKETGEKDTVYSYGEYMRKYVHEVKAKGAHPVLFSLTPRNAWEDKDSTIVTRVNKTFGLWAKQVAEEEHIPFVDLNDITATKFERFGKEKVKTMFYLDRIHTSEFGAKVNAKSAADGIRALKGVALSDYLLPEPVDTVTGSTRRDGIPMLFTIGDSTVKNKDEGDDMWGWGSVIAELFNPDSITVENHAMAGRSARTFLDEGRWDKVYNALQPGDFVLIQFGHNDGGDINTGKARGELHGSGPESKVFKMEKTARNQVIYTYGWYIRKFIMDAKEKGAVPIVLSHTPRNKWDEKGNIESNATSYGLWARQAARQGGAYFIDLNAISGKKYQALSPDKTAPFFKKDHTHSSKAGARLNAASIAEGLRGIDCKLKNYLLPEKTMKFKMDATIPAYNEFDGYGYDFGTTPDAKGTRPYYFSARVPDGNYMVTVTIGNKKRVAKTMVRAENRRLMLDETETAKGKTQKHSFIVSKRSTGINLKDSVKINPREVGTPSWDDKLTLEINGHSPAVESIEIRPVEPTDSVTTLFLCGNSTVVDQAKEPWASWGQIIPAYFDTYVAVSNHAESGERASSFLDKKRLDKVIAMSRPGDWIIMEFGHNDMKERGAGKGAYYNFTTNLKIFIDRARAAGLKPILVTPTVRRSFVNGKNTNTHGDYPQAMREVAAREGVPLIELNGMTMDLFNTFGEEGSKKLLVHYPLGSYPGITRELADNTHFNPFGATEVAKCVVEGLKKVSPELARHIVLKEAFSPLMPDDSNEFYWPNSLFIDQQKPYGN